MSKSFEEKVENHLERNKKFIKEFENHLESENLSTKTIRKHMKNVDIFINDYLNYYDVVKMEDGIDDIFTFLSGWFINKCLCTKTDVQEMCSSLRKFYKCMSELGYVSKEKFNSVSFIMKDNMDYFYYRIDEFDNI